MAVERAKVRSPLPPRDWLSAMRAAANTPPVEEGDLIDAMHVEQITIDAD
jgi:hypothetical protein